MFKKTKILAEVTFYECKEVRLRGLAAGVRVSVKCAEYDGIAEFLPHSEDYSVRYDSPFSASLSVLIAESVEIKVGDMLDIRAGRYMCGTVQVREVLS